MLHPFIKHLFSLLILVLITACSLPQKPVDEAHYNAYQKRQQANLINAHALFDKMEGIDVALFLNEEDFAGLINQSFEAFKTHFYTLDAPAYSHVHFDDMQIELGAQMIHSRIDFSFEVDALKGKLFGYLLTDHEIQAVKDAYRLQTHFQKIVLSGMQIQSELDEADQAAIISNAVESFLHTLNVEIINMPLAIEVDMNVLSGVNGKDIVRSKNYTLHSARAVNMQTKMEIIMPYICTKGVLFAGSSQLKEKYSHEMASTEITALQKALSTKLSKALETSMGVNLDTVQQFSAYYMAKDYVAKQMNFALDYMDLRLIHKFFLPSDASLGALSKEITLFDKLTLPACTGVKENCQSKRRPCDLSCEQQFGPQSCTQCTNVPNPFEQVRCMSKLEKCKSKQALQLYECHKREDQCSLDNDELVNVCEVLNLDKVTACEEKKAALDFVKDSFTLTRLGLSYRVPNSYVVERIKQVRFDESLRGLEVKRNLHISVDSALKMAISPVTHEDFNCSFGLNREFLTHSEVDYSNETDEMPLYAYNTSSGELVLKAISKPSLKSVSLNHSPFKHLMAEKQFRLECRYQTMPMEPLGAEQMLSDKDIPATMGLLLGHLELDMDEEELSFPILPARVGEGITLYPTMQKKVIVFSRQAGF